jgi:hypothetical protein
MKNFKLFFCVAVILLSSTSFGQFRKYSNEFLNIGAGARSLAMGGSQIATAKDAYAGYWNPAGLVEIRDYPSLSLMHAEYFGGIGKIRFCCYSTSNE